MNLHNLIWITLKWYMETYSINSLGKNLISRVQRNENTWKVDVKIIQKQNVQVTLTKTYMIKTLDDIVSMDHDINKVYTNKIKMKDFIVTSLLLENNLYFLHLPLFMQDVIFQVY